MERPIGLPPTCIFAFGFPVPKCAYRPMEAVAAMIMLSLIIAAAIFIVPTIAVLSAAVIGITYLILRYYFRKGPPRIRP